MKWKILLLVALLVNLSSQAQERVGSVNHNPFLKDKPFKSTAKVTALTLPLFEDFTGYGVFPDNTIWQDHEVYVNNTMCVLPVSRGVATFDALDANGQPYTPNNPNALVYADSLTTLPIDLSSHNPVDSIYLSFLYQPQGNGFAPDAGDSLMLFFLGKNGAWRKVWSVDGASLQPFQQVMVPVRDTEFLWNQFQFRFVNIATIGTNDDNWNIDYVRMAANRNVNDTTIRDLAFTTTPSFLLNDLTYMPYRHFIANPGFERAGQQTVNVRNNYPTNSNVVFSERARDVSSNTTLANSNNNQLSVASYTDVQTSVPVYTNTVPLQGIYDKVVFENKFFLNSTPANDPKVNDTIIQNQIFDNYLAYDDGTAEKSYYLNLFPTLPGKIAIEYHLNQPDTLKGVAIYFGRQVPSGLNKYFSATVYKSIAFGGNMDDLIYQEDLFQPGYADTVNKFWYYRFASPVALPAGTFYIGTIQPALSGSDSMYLGLDVNRKGGNHAYYNVLNTWNSSMVDGAIMIRPLLGQDIKGTGISDGGLVAATDNWSPYPNPATNELFITTDKEQFLAYEVSDVTGKTILSGRLESDKIADINKISSGVYFIRLKTKEGFTLPKKLIKL